MGTAFAEIDGYVSETVYPSSYHDTLNPAWTDECLLREGVKPPRLAPGAESHPFTLLDLGCGDGLGMLLLAATHPDSHFIGVDVMPEHIDAARQSAERLGLTNATFHAIDFGQALERDDLGADYIIVQGVLSWVGATAREQLMALIGKSLRPGGVASIGYNAQPGWLGMLSFQRLLRQIALTGQGATYERFEFALEEIRRMLPLGLRSIGPEQLAMIDSHRALLPAKYFAHEYLHESWEPQWSPTVIGQAARHGLSFVRSARPERLREDFILRRAQREELAQVADPVLHELLVDHFTACSFRTDIYMKGDPVRLDEAASEAGRLARPWMRRPGREDQPFELATPAGTIRFDNPAARLVWDAMAQGPVTPGEVVAASEEFDAVDILNVLDALAMRHAVPVEPACPRRDAARIDALLDGAGGEGRLINAWMTAWGPLRQG
ncbi:MAG: class I SAM-dependent methyltransferase [Erythrobacter sp.]|nr:class I SAM-dependent methyltransferase [Erythrobacter sp.]